MVVQELANRFVGSWLIRFVRLWPDCNVPSAFDSNAAPREADMGLEIWREITTEYNGRAIKGSFKFLDGVVTVRTLRGSKAAQVRGQTPEQLAKTLLRELAREGMA